MLLPSLNVTLMNMGQGQCMFGLGFSIGLKLN